MSMIQWDDQYSVGIEEIDDQHKCLIKLINDMYTAMAGGGREEVKVILNELVQYTKTHFAVEETLMRIFHYDKYQEHKAGHDKIIEQVGVFVDRIRAGDNKASMDLLIFLKDWLFDHIAKCDTGYSEVLLKAGIKSKSRWVFWKN